MSEFAAYMEDWSLQAIVHGSSGDFSKILDEHMAGDQDPLFDFAAADDREFLAGFPEIFEVPTGFGDELEDLYKAFYPVTYSLPARAVLDFQEQQPHNVIEKDQKLATDESDQSSGSSGSVATIPVSTYTPKYKRRKNQHKRVVIQVTAEGLSSDMWAWRKYGQKPIKGSPYPRSYYRCSSSKGCLARKQVEQSCNDPGKFIVTYSVEHNHSQPTRRNSLAGTVRQKFPSTRKPNGYKTFKKEASEESNNFPKIPTEAVLAQTRIMKEEIFNKPENEAQARVKEESQVDDHDFVLSEFELNEDFFSGLEEFDDFNMQLPGCRDSVNKLPIRSRS